MDKRQFLKSLGTSALSVGFMDHVQRLVGEYQHLAIPELAKEEEFWTKVRMGYKLKSEYINLENGYYCITPQETLEHYIDHIREVNYQGSYYMRKMQNENKDKMAARLAAFIGADDDEVVITRNTTESLDIIIGGFKWKAGDEAVYAAQDYGAMIHMFELQARRHGIVNKVVSMPNHPSSDDEIVALYENAIGPKTRLLMISHMINITGHILPVRKICDMAHRYGVQVMVDGAHAVGHIKFNIKDLDCDYYGSSLHKWLSVPLGSGLLYVRKAMASQIWPTFASWGIEDDDIKNLNHTGTIPVHTHLALGNALDYLHALGLEKKEARLRYLQNYWTDQVRDHPGIRLNTPKERHRSCGIANVGIEKMTPNDMATTLLEKFGIWTVAIDGVGVQGCRITPNIFTKPAELDVFINALKEMAM